MYLGLAFSYKSCPFDIGRLGAAPIENGRVFSTGYCIGYFELPSWNSSVRYELTPGHKENNFTLMHIREADQKNAKIVIGWNRRQEHFDTV
jgi:hypothetical protein